METVSKQRNTNFEVLRIIAMLLIFWGHGIAVAGIQTEAVFISTRLVSEFLGNGARISVSIFLLLSAWFMIDMDFKAERILNIWFETVSYVLIFSVVGYVLVPNSSIFSLLTSVLPLSFWQLWYPAAYMIWLLLMPILKSICEKISDRRMLQFVVLLSFLFVFQSSYQGLQDSRIVVIAWLIYMYFFVWFLKKNVYSPLKANWFRKLPTGSCLVFGIILYCILSVAKWLVNNFECSILGVNVSDYGVKLLDLWVVDYKSLPNFLIAILIFLGVSSLKPHFSKVVNRTTKSIFAIYCIHEVPLFKEYFWKELMNLDICKGATPIDFLLHLICITIAFFGIVFILDSLRDKYIQKAISRSKLYKVICAKINVIMAE